MSLFIFAELKEDCVLKRVFYSYGDSRSFILTIFALVFAAVSIGLFITKLALPDFKEKLKKWFKDNGFNLGGALLLLGLIDIAFGAVKLTVGIVTGNAWSVGSAMMSFAAGITDIVTGIQAIGVGGTQKPLIVDKDIEEWAKGLSEFFNCSRESAESMIIHATTYSYSSDISKLRESFGLKSRVEGDNSVEYITLIYLENILKVGPKYIHESSQKKVSLDKAEQIYQLFVSRSQLGYIKYFDAH